MYVFVCIAYKRIKHKIIYYRNQFGRNRLLCGLPNHGTLVNSQMGTKLNYVHKEPI